MPADAEDVVRRLQRLHADYLSALELHDATDADGAADEIAAMTDDVVEEIERQSAEIAKLQAERNAYESPAWEANERLNAKCEEAWAEIATLRAQVAALENEYKRARVAGCSPTPAPDASPQSAHPTSGRTT